MKHNYSDWVMQTHWWWFVLRRQCDR